MSIPWLYLRTTKGRIPYVEINSTYQNFQSRMNNGGGNLVEYSNPGAWEGRSWTVQSWISEFCPEMTIDDLEHIANTDEGYIHGWYYMHTKQMFQDDPGYIYAAQDVSKFTGRAYTWPYLSSIGTGTPAYDNGVTCTTNDESTTTTDVGYVNYYSYPYQPGATESRVITSGQYPSNRGVFWRDGNRKRSNNNPTVFLCCVTSDRRIVTCRIVWNYPWIVPDSECRLVAIGLDLLPISDFRIDPIWDNSPEPPPEKEGLFDLINRFSPRSNSNIVGMYILTKEQLRAVFNDLWTTGFFEGFQETILGDPINAVMGVRWYYGLYMDIKRTADYAYVQLGNNPMRNVGKVSVAASEFCEHDCGALVITPYFGDYRDYAPYTNIQLYIPFYGFVDLPVNEVMEGTVYLTYNINIFTGQAVAIVSCSSPRTGDVKTELMTIPCQMGTEIPVQINKMATLDNIIGNQIMATGISLLNQVTKGAFSESATYQGATSVTSTTRSYDKNGRERVTQTQKDIGASETHTNNMGSVDFPTMNNAPAETISRGSGYSQDAGMLGSFVPFVLVERSVSLTPTDSNDYFGKPAYITSKLSNVSGFTQIAAIKPESVSPGNKYNSEIVALLQAGVYL